jgi:hypothetical protein
VVLLGALSCRALQQKSAAGAIMNDEVAGEAMVGLTACSFLTIGQSSCKSLHPHLAPLLSREKRPEPEEKHMDIRYGLISADSHVVTDKDAFVTRMSKSRWGDRTPQVIEVESNGRLVHRWAVNGKALGGRGCAIARRSWAIPCAMPIRSDGKIFRGKPMCRVSPLKLSTPTV